MLSASFYDYPANKIKIIGITGTNGKTTTTFVLDNILQKAGYKTTLLGTVYNKIGDNIYPTHNTTLESLELNQIIAKSVDIGIDYVVMEVSSHALAMYRAWGILFDGAIFTNIANEHFELQLEH